MTYNFDLVFASDSGSFTIGIDTQKHYGFFEHDILGDEFGGGLWFDEQKLIDFDGTNYLPKEVYESLINRGFEVPQEFL